MKMRTWLISLLLVLPAPVAGARETSVRRPAIEAIPAMLPEGSTTTTIRWDTGDGSNAQVYFSDDGKPDVLFAGGASGSKSVTWIHETRKCRFRLYRGDAHNEMLAEVSVYGWRLAKGKKSFELGFAYVAGLGTVLLPLGASRLLKRKRLAAAELSSVDAAVNEPIRRPRRTAPKWTARKAGFVLVTNAVLLGLAFSIGEYSLRWAKEGGAVAGLKSFFLPRTPINVRARQQNWMMPDPYFGHRLNPAEVALNSIGIRNREVSRDKAPGLFRIILLGDSVTFNSPPGQKGGEGSLASSLTKRLEGTPPGRVEVINGAIAGYTIYQERLLLERDLLPLHPDLVILQYCLNDNYRFQCLFDANGDMRYTREAQATLDLPGAGWWSRLSRSSYLIYEIRTRLLRGREESRGDRFPWDINMDFCGAWQDQTWDVVEENLKVMRDEITRRGARLAMVAVPYEPQLDQNLIDRDPNYTRKPQRLLSEICTRNGVPLLDLYPALLASRAKKLFWDKIHLTPDGISLATDQIVQFVAREKLLPDGSKN
jgi:lysophospholipase L1-like esterase